MKRIFANLVALTMLWTNHAAAQISEAKLIPSDGGANHTFGNSVAISGDYAIVGARVASSAYVFKRDGANWIEQAKLVASDNSPGDRFGISVSISGNYAIVGNRNPFFGNVRSAAYIYRLEGEAWIEKTKLTASDFAPGDQFGISVSISGDYAIIGANTENAQGLFAGSAYIFKREGENWIEQSKLTASDGALGDQFGLSVAVFGDYAIAGSRFDDDSGSDSGSAYIFKRDGENWLETAKLTASDGSAGDVFGGSVSVSSDFAIVGQVRDDDSGSAYIFKREGTSWMQTTKLTASDSSSGDLFGTSVSISGDDIIVGRLVDDGDDSGSAYIFKRDGENWLETAKLTASDGSAGDVFGTSVSISGDYAIAGAKWDDDNGDDSGSAYVFNGFSPPTAVEEEISDIPTKFTLAQNYPNPFNPETAIRFELQVASDVRLRIYNILGREVRELVGKPYAAGSHTVQWDGKEDKGLQAPSGIYFYRLQAGEFTQVRKMSLIR